MHVPGPAQNNCQLYCFRGWSHHQLPIAGSTVGTSVLVDASATESGASIDHLEVWDNGTKLGNSPPGSTIHQTFVLSSGSHQMTVQDISTGTFQSCINRSLPLPFQLTA